MIGQTINEKFLKLANDQQNNEQELLNKENVVGVALGYKFINQEETDEPSIHVLVRNKMPQDLLSKEDLIPKKLGSVKTDVIEVGEVVAGPLAPDIDNLTQTGLDMEPEDMESQIREEIDEILSEPRMRERKRQTRAAWGRPAKEAVPEILKQRVRPAQGGFSIGHYRTTAGTIATACYDAAPFPSVPQQFYLLSNNHVLANTNNARIGDPILQPGPYDGGAYPRDMIGRLSRFIPLRFKTSNSAPLNYVDAAIAEVPFHQCSRELYWIGYLKGTYTAPNVGDVVQKTGRTSDYSTGRVQSVNATIDVSYGNGRVARFARQIITTRMSAGGDSGSLITSLDEKAVGLLFAGSPYITVANNILYVQSMLKIRLHEK
jgi:hypothetical protein